MHRILTLMVFTILMMGLLNSCPKEAVPPPPETDYTAADSGRSIDLKVGDTFTVGLSSAPSTAYFWEIDELDSAVVENTADEYVPDPATRDHEGGGGMDVWSFRAVAPGQTELKMLNARKTEPKEPRGDFTLTIIVSE